MLGALLGELRRRRRDLLGAREAVAQALDRLEVCTDDVMRIARELAGYTMGEAELLRRAMGKKIASEMAQHREKFIEGGKKRGVPAPIAEQIFEQAAKFVDIEQLALSPQCGFASTQEGNTLAEREQWAKLRMIVQIAKEVWG